MSNLATALRDKISSLDDEREELEDSLNRVTEKIGLLESLLVDETGGEASAPAKKRTRGRPKGSKGRKTTDVKKKVESVNAPKDALWEQAESSLPEGSSGSTIEEQQKAIRRFNPTPRTPPNYGVKAGKPEDVLADQGNKKSNVNISVEDD